MDAIARHRRQFAYDRWANGLALSALAAIDAPPPRAVRWLAHIVAAEVLWLERILGLPQSLPVWPDLGVEGCTAEWTTCAQRWTSYLDELTAVELARAFDYVNSRGDRFTSRVDDVLTHVVVHGAHHRGQIVAELRAHGHEPPYTDFVQAARTGVLD